MRPQGPPASASAAAAASPTRPAITERIDARQAWRILGVALLAQIAVSVVTQGIPTLSPFLEVDFSLSHGEVAFFGSALTIGTVLTVTAAGWAVDRYGDRAVLFVGNVLVGLATLAMAATHQLGPAFVALLFVGAGAAMPTPAGSRAIMLSFPPDQRGMAIGLRQTGIPLGGAVAALVLPAMAIALGWQSGVIAAGVFSLVAAAICWAVYREPVSAGIHSVGGASAGWQGILRRDAVLVGLSGFVLPIGQFCLVTYLALFLRATQGIPIETSAGLLVLAQLAGAAGRIGGGLASDRLFGNRRRPPLVLYAVLGGLSAAALGLLPGGTPLWVIGAVVLVFGFCAIGWQGNWVALLAELSRPGQQGRTLGLGMASSYLGISAGPPLFGALVDHTGLWWLAWLLLGAALAIGAVLLLIARETPAD